ncbi:HD domain-containing phosphohydrolase [Leptospira yasudae]|uniref:response regulator n=1 Tax=Leptospira yasudae TaxID=2202201 RepID=UPI001AEFEED4|nr:HD domain-containing phosphohydrolase [Leptospira yasudae]
MTSQKRKKVMIVEDSPVDLAILKHYLEKDYDIIALQNPYHVVQSARSKHPDLVLLDVVMSKIGGFEICKRLKSDPDTTDIPVIFISSTGDSSAETLGFDLGAVDFFHKPVSAPVFRARIKSHIELSRMTEIKSSRLEIIRKLGVASEYRDNETGNHLLRMSRYCQVLAKSYGLDLEEVEDIYVAATMHDVGKIGIPDSILLKQEKLTPEEFKVIKTHPVIGANIIGEHKSGVLKVARDICIGHHEKWDGSGYPYGLKGNEISLPARIASIADVFDALHTDRPYKKGWPIGQAVDYILSQAGISFDPELVILFQENLIEILKAKTETVTAA